MCAQSGFGIGCSARTVNPRGYHRHSLAPLAKEFADITHLSSVVQAVLECLADQARPLIGHLSYMQRSHLQTTVLLATSNMWQHQLQNMLNTFENRWIQHWKIAQDEISYNLQHLSPFTVYSWSSLLWFIIIITIISIVLHHYHLDLHGTAHTWWRRMPKCCVVLLQCCWKDLSTTYQHSVNLYPTL